MENIARAQAEFCYRGAVKIRGLMGACLGWALVGCSPAPVQVMGSGNGQSGTAGGSTMGDATGAIPDGTGGPVAEGSGGDGSSGSMGTNPDGSTTQPVDPDTTGNPQTTDDPSTTGNPETTSGPGSTTDPGGSSSSGMPLSCDDVFGTAKGYQLCGTDGMSCTFQVNVNGASCQTLCTSFGQACLGAQDNPGSGDLCVVQGPLTCADSGKSSTICICEL